MAARSGPDLGAHPGHSLDPGFIREIRARHAVACPRRRRVIRGKIAQFAESKWPWDRISFKREPIPMNTITIRPFAAAKLLTVAALALGGCHVTGIRGNGDITTENRTVPDFTSVEADGAFTITWSNGPAGFKITTDQNLLRHVETSVRGTKLRIHSRGQLRPTEGIKVTLSSSGLSGASLTGAVRLTATKLSGKGLYLEGTGATRVVADGTVSELMASMSGASKLEASSLQAETVVLSISGAGKAEVAASKTLKVSISGAGKVTYTGNPTVEKHISGAGSVRQRD